MRVVGSGRRRATLPAVLVPVGLLSFAAPAAATKPGRHRPNLPGKPVGRTCHDRHRQACITNNCAVSQYSGPSPVVVPGSSTMTLTQLGAAVAHSPQIRFLDRPVNQDAYKSATLTPAYLGSRQGN